MVCTTTPATNSSTPSARRPRLPPHDRRSLRLRRSDSTSGQSVASGVHSGGTLAFDPAESVDEGRPSSRPSSMPHRSRAGHWMPAVGAGGRGSRCVHRARPAPRCRRDSWDARSREAPCRAGSPSCASSSRARDDRERTAGKRVRSSGIRGDAERSQESARLQRERQRGGRRRHEGRENEPTAT